jgi:hypothetical protein
MPIWRNTLGDFNWGTAGNWAVDGSGNTGIPTNTTDAIFDALSPNCVVNGVARVCRNLNCTGYGGQLDMAFPISVGNTSLAGSSITLSSSMSVIGSSVLNVLGTQGTTTLTSNGFLWPTALHIGNATVNTVPIYQLNDNWSVASLLLSNGSSNALVTGNFTISVFGNFRTNNTTGTIRGNLGSTCTIRLVGPGTWSAAGVGVTLSLNVTIDAGANTYTLGTNATWGLVTSGGVANPALTYVSGTVAAPGTFTLVQGSNTQTVNLNGSTSPAATSTSSTGVNFQNLNIRGHATTSLTTFSSTVCVVGTLTSSSNTGIDLRTFIGGTFRLNGSLVLNNHIEGDGTLIFQGTGNWTENNGTLTKLNYGITANVVINTLGTITLTTSVAVRGQLTYTNGTFVQGLNTILMAGATSQGASLNGFASAGIVIQSLRHRTQGLVANNGSLLSFNDSVPYSIINLSFDGFTVSNNAHRHMGTTGWTCVNFTYSKPTNTANLTPVYSLMGSSTIQYIVTNSFIFRAGGPIFGVSTSQMVRQTGVVPVQFIVQQGASQDVYYMGAQNIDSSAGQTIWTRSGTVFSTSNWNLWTYPRTRFSSSIG